MSDELFPAETVTMDSPRRAWALKHRFRLHHSQFVPDIPWTAWLPDNDATIPDKNGDLAEAGLPMDPDLCGYGATEEDALIECAKVNGLKLWNEESP